MHTSKVPKIVSSLSDIHNPQALLLKQEMKKFINDIQQQFDSVITGYEKQLLQLQKQQSPSNDNKSKRSQKHTTSITINNNSNLNGDKLRKSNNDIDQSNEIDEIEQWMLPLNSKDFNVSTSSPFYRTPKRSWRDVMSPLSSPWGSVVKMREESPRRREFALTMKQIDQKTNKNNTSISTSRHPYSHIESQHHRSRYQCRSQTKKQRQQQIVQCLQSQRKNLNQMTSKMMTMMGRDACNDKDQQESNQDNNQLQSQSQINQFNQSKQGDQHNRSLNNICGSLNNSHVSQQTRKARLKKKLIEEENQKKNKQTQIQNQKARRQLAIKSLLSRLRQNANSIQPPQTVKGSKLLSTGHVGGSSVVVKTQKQGSSLRKNSKVLINPVPVSSPLINISMGEDSRSFVQNKESFMQKRPTSILRQSNILTRSISGISAVSYNQ